MEMMELIEFNEYYFEHSQHPPWFHIKKSDAVKRITLKPIFNINGTDMIR